MKTVICPIDFSPASANALAFAVELCKRAKARLYVSNAIMEPDDEEGAREKLKQVEADLKAAHPGLECVFRVDFGDVAGVLHKLVSTEHPDIVVMGTKGASGLKKVMIGSNAVKVITDVNVPVFIIPEAARFENYNRKGKSRIVLATDLEELADYKSLNILKEIAMLIIDPKLRVLNVRPKKTELPVPKEMERRALLSIFEPEIQAEKVTVFGSSILSGISYYLDSNTDSGLLAMISRDSGQIIQKHYTRDMASHTDYPLLVMHDAKVD